MQSRQAKLAAILIAAIAAGVGASVLGLIGGARDSGGVDPAASPDTTQVTISGRAFTLENALTEPARRQGLSGRAWIAPDGGMLFVFPEAEPQVFVMRDCQIPLDLILLDDAGRVLSTHAMSVEPPRSGRELELTEEADQMYTARLKAYACLRPVRYAIEVRGGLVEKLRVREGDRILVGGSSATMAALVDRARSASSLPMRGDADATAAHIAGGIDRSAPPEPPS